MCWCPSIFKAKSRDCLYSFYVTLDETKTIKHTTKFFLQIFFFLLLFNIVRFCCSFLCHSICVCYAVDVVCCCHFMSHSHFDCRQTGAFSSFVCHLIYYYCFCSFPPEKITLSAAFLAHALSLSLTHSPNQTILAISLKTPFIAHSIASIQSLLPLSSSSSSLSNNDELET